MKIIKVFDEVGGAYACVGSEGEHVGHLVADALQKSESEQVAVNFEGITLITDPFLAEMVRPMYDYDTHSFNEMASVIFTGLDSEALAELGDDVSYVMEKIRFEKKNPALALEIMAEMHPELEIDVATELAKIYNRQKQTPPVTTERIIQPQIYYGNQVRFKYLSTTTHSSYSLNV